MSPRAVPLRTLHASGHLWAPPHRAPFAYHRTMRLCVSTFTPCASMPPQMLKNIATAITPSAWKKSYQGVGEGEDQPPKVLLDLPAWQGDEARELEEPEAVLNIKSMRLEPIEVAGVGPVETCFMSLKPDEPADAPPLLLIHGFDSSLLEFRYIAPALVEAGLRGTPPHAPARAAPRAEQRLLLSSGPSWPPAGPT